MPKRPIDDEEEEPTRIMERPLIRPIAKRPAAPARPRPPSPTVDRERTVVMPDAPVRPSRGPGSAFTDEEADAALDFLTSASPQPPVSAPPRFPAPPPPRDRAGARPPISAPRPPSRPTRSADTKPPGAQVPSSRLPKTPPPTRPPPAAYPPPSVTPGTQRLQSYAPPAHSPAPPPVITAPPPMPSYPPPPVLPAVATYPPPPVLPAVATYPPGAHSYPPPQAQQAMIPPPNVQLQVQQSGQYPAPPNASYPPHAQPQAMMTPPPPNVQLQAQQSGQYPAPPNASYPPPPVAPTLMTPYAPAPHLAHAPPPLLPLGPEGVPLRQDRRGSPFDLVLLAAPLAAALTIIAALALY